jgi:tetratricopeptide (TPR) repeat protein
MKRLIVLIVFTVLCSSFAFTQEAPLKLDTGMSGKQIASIIFKHDVKPVLAIKDAIINWKSILEGLKQKYTEINAETEKGLEDIFRKAIDVEIIRSIPQTVSMTDADWYEIADSLKKRFPGYDFGQVLLLRMGCYYQQNEIWNKCEKIYIKACKKYANNIPDVQMNEIIWYGIFLHSNNRSSLKKAVKLMKKIVEKNDDPTFYDTYANLLYKTGSKDKAVSWQQKAVNLAAKEPDIQIEIKDNLEKMKKGEKTWMN